MCAKVLVVDDLPINRQLIATMLEQQYYVVYTAVNGKEAIELASSINPDIIIMDAVMPEIDGIEATTIIRNSYDKDVAMIPIIILTAMNDSMMRIAALNAGADDFLQKPINIKMLWSRIQSCLRLRNLTNTMKDLDPKMQIEYDVCLDKEKLLHNSKFLIITTDQYVDEYDVLFYDANIEYQIVTQSYYEKIIYDFKPDIVILDGRISEDFLAIASQLLHNDNTKDIPILLIFQLMQFDIIEKALSMGVQDYVTIPVDQNELFARSIILLCRNKYHKLLKLRYSDILSDANIDPLTKLNTRSFFEKKVTKMLSQLVTTAVLLIIDIDEFKSINDRFGHKAGDIALITIATIIQQNIKVTDIVCRLGGEEFLVYLHNSTIQDAEIVAARLIDAIAKAPITFNDINNNYCIIYCTCSIGGKYITCQQPINAFNCFSDLLIKADQNLYIVKRKEKNDYLIN